MARRIYLDAQEVSALWNFGNGRPRERPITCPQCAGRGHVIVGADDNDDDADTGDEDDLTRAFDWVRSHLIVTYGELQSALAAAPNDVERGSRIVRLHIIRRAKVQANSNEIPFTWNSDGSLNNGERAFKF